MLRITNTAGVAGAKSYFTESLDRGDYYTEGQELAGWWGGKAAKELGLTGEVSQKDFFALCENRHPADGGPLTLRTKTNRRVGYDINFHVPKDVSVVYALTEDRDILTAFEDAVGKTMSLIEENMQCRVRKNGAQEDRLTGNLAWSMFVHQTARPVGGIPDPHLHAHCLTFNATKDSVEGAWKAGQFGGIKKDGEFYETAFHTELRRGLEAAGYETEEAGRYFRLKDSPVGLTEKNSARKKQVEAEAAKKGINDAKQKDGLGARTREAKQKADTMSDLRPTWRDRLDIAEIEWLNSVKGKPRSRGARTEEKAAAKAAEFAKAHIFERYSVVSEKSFFTTAMRHAGSRASARQVLTACKNMDLLRRELDGRPMVTTKEALAEEKAMLDFARKGRGQYAPFADKFDASKTTLSESQGKAAEGLLSSRDRVTVLRGGAGTGKTYMMKAVTEAISKQRKTVFAFAPTTDAAHRVLRDDGFTDAETVQRLLVDKKLQSQLKNQVLWVDEAGLLGTRQIGQVFQVAAEQKARVILSGDDRQHGSVERGGPFGLLRESGVRSVGLEAIRRQQGDYLRIVQKIAKGKRQSAYRDLVAAGAVKEGPQREAHQAIAREVREASTKTKPKLPLVIAPTHAEKDKLTGTIRSELRDAQLLRGKERTYTRYQSLQMTEAERRDTSNYEQGQVIQFGKKARGFGAGERTEVKRTDPLGNVWVQGKRGPVVLNNDQADRYEVYEKKELTLAAGDKIRITRSGKCREGVHALRNGAEYHVSGFIPATGDIKLSNGWIVSKGFGHIDNGYVQTSFNSQGKSVDRVIVAQSAESFGASNAEQFYVSVSRGRKAVQVYTDSIDGLAARIDKVEEHKNAHDAIKDRNEPTPQPRKSQDERRKEQDRDR